MSSVNRRRFPGIARAASIPADRRTGSIRDIEHIVVRTPPDRSVDGEYDISFHRALADAFTLCDAYHGSRPSDPGGYPWWNGSVGNAEDGWTTYPERLEKAGVSGKVYRDEGDGLEAAALRDDVLAGKLPQVSWIATPEANAEHPNRPAGGAGHVARVLDALTADPDVWSRTALFVTYDDDDGRSDDVVPPYPQAGHSTVDVQLDLGPGVGGTVPGPYGLGARVPMIVVSPWTTGGYVDSEVFDHTSIIRFMERRFGVREPAISPWRRAVCGDLTSAFDFGRARPAIPAVPALAEPGTGVRPARPVSYDLVADGRTDGSNLRIDFACRGRIGAVFHVTSSAGDPRSYTVGAGQHLSGTWSLSETVTVRGPNGFRRDFAAGGVDVVARHEHGGDVEVTLSNHGSQAVRLTLSDGYRRGHTDVVRLRPGQRALRSIPAGRNHGWYDVTITGDTDRAYVRRLAGHVETGRPSISDPARGGRADG